MAKKEKILLDPDFLSALEYIREGGDEFSRVTLFAFSDLTLPEMEQFVKTWALLPAARRRRVSQAMTELAEDSFEADFVRIFRYLMDDEDPEVRQQAIEGLWEDEDIVLINPLIAAMRSDAAARVRAAAAESLGRFVLLSETKRIPAERGERVAEALLAVVRDGGEDPLVRRRAIESISYLGNEMVRDIVASAYADEDGDMRASAVFAMGRSADPYWRRTVVQELYSPDPQLRYEAARAIGELEYKPAVPRLIELLDDPDREVQSASITSLGQIGGKEAKEALEEVVEGEDEVNRELAQDALDELEFASSSELLLYDMDLADNAALDLPVDLELEELEDLDPLEEEEEEDE